jgi:predicted ATPase
MSVLTEAELLERTDEVEALQAAVAQAAEGRGLVVVIEGPPGIGKTRLLREARTAAERLGMRTLAARGTELERDFPFAIARQLFEPALAGAETA